MSLPKTIVGKPTTIFIVFVILVGLGLYSARDLEIDLYPDVTIPILVVICTAEQGTGPEEVENTITRTLESSLGSVGNLEKITSTSAEGGSTIMLNFAYGTDMSEAANDVRDKIDFVKAYLPDGADTPRIFKFDPAMFPIMYLSLRGNRTAEELKKIADDIIAPRLEQVEGVATAGVDGGRNRMIRVEVHQNRLNAYNLSLSTLAQMLRGQNVQISAGTISEGNKNYLIQTAGEYESIEQIGNTVIASLGKATVRLKDIATIHDGFEDEASIVYHNGEPAVQIIVQKQSGTNAVETADNVKKRLEQIKSEIPRGVTLETVYDQTVNIRNSINQVTWTAIMGFVLAILILFFFLRDIKSVIIIGVSIPVSIIVTLMFMYFFDLTLNMMTLAGLALGIGMLVDNSIVILENIFRYREKGAKLTASAILGSQEMISAIIAATLTTICVFLPLALFKDQLEIVGQLVSALAFTIVFSLTSSIVVAIFLVPVLSSHYLPLTSKLEKLNRLGINIWFDKMFDGLDNLYKRALRVVLRHRAITIIVITVLFVGSCMLIPMAGINFMPAQEGDVIQIDIELPVGTKLEETQHIVEQFKAIIENETEGIKDIVTTAGLKSFFGFMGAADSHKAQILLTLPPYKERIDTASVIKDKLRAHFNDFPSVTFKFSEGGGMGGGGSPIDILVKSNDLDKAREFSTKIKDLIKENVPDATEPDVSFRGGLPQVEIFIDRDKAYSFGLNIYSVANEIEANIKGIKASRFRDGAGEYDIMLILDEEDRKKIPDLEQIFVMNPRGQRIPLANFSYYKKTTGPVAINRENQMRTIHVTAGLRMGAKLNEVSAAINELIETEIPKDDDVIISMSGDAADMQEIGFKFIIILLISIFLVYGVMASQFESFLDPFIITFTIPLMVIGVVFIYLVTGEQFSMFTAVGLVVLSGIVVNNGIVLVDYTNLLIKRGYGIIDACAEAGGNRLRPILMTTLTTILGLLPMAFVTGEGSELSQPIAKTVVGGLTFSTLFTLFLIPAIYSIFTEKAQKRKAKRAARRQKRLEIRKEKIARIKAEREMLENGLESPETDSDVDSYDASASDTIDVDEKGEGEDRGDI